MCARKIQMPREVYIGPGVVQETGEICSNLKLFKDIVLVTGNNTYSWNDGNTNWDLLVIIRMI